MALKELMAATPHAESPQRKERYQVCFDALTISGPAGTGKTTVGRILSHLLNKPYHKVGADIREEHRQQTGEEIVGAVPRAGQRDKAADEQTAWLIREGTGWIIEGHLAGVIAHEQQDKHTVRVFLTTQDPSEAFRRVQRRQNAVIEEKNRRAEAENERRRRFNELLQHSDARGQYYLPIEIPPIPKLTLKQVIRDTKERQRANRALWSKIYPERDNLNPYDRDCPVYNLVIDTDTMSAEQVADYLVKWLIKKVYVKRAASETEAQPRSKLNSEKGKKKKLAPKGDIVTKEDLKQLSLPTPVNF